MKIGIITIHNAYNYGATLQAFALREYLKKRVGENSEVNVIDYRTDFLESKKKIHFTKDFYGNLIEFEKVIMFPKLKRRANAFENFMINNDSLSEICKTKEEVENLIYNYDVVISGSDQVWNFYITDGDTTYLLDFPSFNGILMSYASSLGIYRFLESDTKRIKKIFDKYSFYSCREKDGCEYLSEFTGKSWTNVCDPTLLLDCKDYLDKCNDTNVSKKVRILSEEKYLLIYNLNSSNEIMETAEKIAKSKNLKIYQIFPSIRKHKVVDKLINDASPEEFLYLYFKADFILTNSFHGTCFSIINNKQFFTIKPAVSNNRLESMLESLGISERLVIDMNNFSLQNIEEIDYNIVNQNLKNFRTVSEKFLENALDL